MDTSLDTQLDAIGQLKPAARGNRLEQLVAEVFRQLHFKVRLNSGSAHPRQTDVLASKVNEHYLIECKWRTDKANIDDLDSLRARLRRTDPGIIGILVSIPGFTGTVLSEVQQHRSDPVLLISGDELRRLTAGFGSLPELLWRKKEALLADGRVLLDEPAPRSSASRRRADLPQAESDFMFADGQRSKVVECGGGFGQRVFVHELPDVDWVAAGGVGATLDVAPEVHNERGLLDLIERLDDLGWASRDARWAIQQMTRNWHGLGSAAFAAELPGWQKRARSPDAHHSEEVCYLDRCDGGFYSLTAGLTADKFRRAMMVRLSFQLEGVPLDTSPLVQLCRSVGVHDGLYFRPRAERSVTRHGSAELRRSLQPIAYLVTPERNPKHRIDEWVTGLVVDNPFLGAELAELPPHFRESFELLKDCQHLVCDLAGHHARDDRKYIYHFRGLELAWTSDALVCRPLANWTWADSDDVPKRTQPGD